MSSTLSRQRGLSITGLLFSVALLCVVGLLVMKIVPTVLEAKAMDSAILKARSGSTTDVEARRAFVRASMIDDITSIGPNDLIITKDGGDLVISYAYTAKIRLVGPASLIIEYSGTTKGR